MTDDVIVKNDNDEHGESGTPLLDMVKSVTPHKFQKAVSDELLNRARSGIESQKQDS